MEFSSNLVVEYLLSTLILNLAVMVITCVIFGHTEGYADLLNGSVAFAMRYMILASALALVCPIVWNMVSIQWEGQVPVGRIHPVSVGLFFLSAVVFLLIGLSRCFDNAFWGDEGYTILLARLPVSDMIRATAGDVHPPLYYLFTKGLYCLFGNNGVTYHLSAWIPYVLIIGLACTVIRREFGVITAGFVVVFDSLMNEAITHNAEARMYTLAAFFVLATYIELYYILKSEKRTVVHWVLFALCALGAAYTHYYALITVAFFYLTLLIIMFSQHRLIRPTIITCIATVVGYLPWLAILLSTFKRTAVGWWLNGMPKLMDALRNTFDDTWLLCIFFLVVIIYALYQLRVVSVTYDKEHVRELKNVFQMKVHLGTKMQVSQELIWVLAGVAAFVGTAAVGIGVSHLVRPLFIVRYCYPASMAAYMVMGYCISKLNFRRFWATLLCITVFTLHMPGLIGTCRSERELNKNTTAFMQAVQPEQDEIIATNVIDINWTLSGYYYPQSSHTYCADEMSAVETGGKTLLIWNAELSEDTLKEMSREGLEVVKVYEGQFPNSIYCYAYRVTR